MPLSDQVYAVFHVSLSQALYSVFGISPTHQLLITHLEAVFALHAGCMLGVTCTHPVNPSASLPSIQ